MTEQEIEKTQYFPLKLAYPFGADKGMGAEVDKIKNMEIEWDRTYTTSVKRGYLIELFEKRGVLDEFKASYWPFGKTPKGEALQRRFLRIKQQYDDWLATGDVTEPDAEDDSGQAFAAESDLRDFLASNLNRIEAGLHLYENGVEFPVDSGRIDILARDQKERFVVIELKVSRGRSKAIGQLLYYMGWVDKNLGGKPCRGLIIAKEISNDLVLAVQRAPGISLAQYHLAVTIEAVHTST